MPAAGGEQGRFHDVHHFAECASGPQDPQSFFVTGSGNGCSPLKLRMRLSHRYGGLVLGFGHAVEGENFGKHDVTLFDDPGRLGTIGPCSRAPADEFASRSEKNLCGKAGIAQAFRCGRSHDIGFG